ncbi:10879_t:CDS:2, partial [Gigaspora margarita]
GATLDNFRFALETWLYNHLISCELVSSVILNALLGSAAWNETIHKHFPFVLVAVGTGGIDGHAGIENIDLEVLLVLINFLNKFKEASNYLKSSKNSILYLIISWYKVLKEHYKID